MSYTIEIPGESGRYSIELPKSGAQMEAEATGPIEAGVIGAGRMLDQGYKGLKQLALSPFSGNQSVAAELARMAAEEAGNKQIYGALQAAHPVATTVGEVGALLPGGFLAPGFGGAALAGSIPGLISYGSPEERALHGAAGAAGGVVGQGVGVVAGKVLPIIGGAAINLFRRVLGRPGVPEVLTSPQQQAIIREAQALGYELTPGQITGKPWQQNLDAVLSTMPSTSGRMQQMAAGNVQRTQGLVDAALQNMGGAVDQPAAAAAAMRGWESGLRTEEGRIGSAYDSLLNGRTADLEAARPQLSTLLGEQMRLPATARSGKGVAALEDLLGSPGYNGAAARAGTLSRSPDVQADDIVTAVRKMGGINPGDEALGSLARQMPFGPDPRIGAVWRNPAYTGSSNLLQNTRAGHSLPEITEKLYAKGYVSSRDATDEVVQKLMDSSTGVGSHFSIYREGNGQVDPLADAINSLVGRLDAKTAPPAPRAGYIRDNPDLDAGVAQSLRSDYSRASAEEMKGRDRQLFGAMKGAVDFAIDKALPENLKGDFAAINQQYGRFAVLNQMTPTQQAAFLSNLYRGGKSPDVFYTFLGMAPEGEFKDVARGFVTDIVQKSVGKGGNVDAAALGRNVRRADPDALKFLGGDTGEQLASIGRVGENVLRDPISNSGTPQRALFQSLLQGGGFLGGGGLGYEQNGGFGAAVGAGAGTFLLPKAAQGVYLSQLARGLLTKPATQYGGVPLLNNAMSPGVREALTRFLGAEGIAGANAAMQ